MKCQVCESFNVFKFLSLGNQPVPNHFLNDEDLEKPEQIFPLEIFFCNDCSLVQLGYAVDPKILFTDDFLYTTGSNKELVENFRLLVQKLVKDFDLSKKDFAIDIGSNDGTLLENYLPFGVKVLGIDPSKAAKMAVKKNVPTMFEFFNEQTAENILKEYGLARIITATNVFAHVKEIDSLMKSIKILLKEDGVFVEESHYILDLVSKMQYDSIYSEHLRYYSLKSLICLFEKFGLEVFDAQRIPNHGGSLRVFAGYKGQHKKSKNIEKILKEEKAAGIYSKKKYILFAKKVSQNRDKLRNLLLKIKKSGKRVVGIGAPAKGNTLLNYCNLDTGLIDYIVEKQGMKIGKFSPGMHIKILDETKLLSDQPDYGLLLSWNLKDIIIKKLRENGFKGKFIIPIPKPAIV